MLVSILLRNMEMQSTLTALNTGGRLMVGLGLMALCVSIAVSIASPGEREKEESNDR